MINGVVNVRKEKGMTSFDVIARLRRILGQRKMGHTGTLDPDAEGVLPVCLGKATRLVDMISGGTKTYQAEILFGIVTDTEDTTGKILEENEVTATASEAAAVLSSIDGVQKQTPPMYSAVKIGGRKLCDLARRGIEVERVPREVEFSDIKILDTALPKIRFEVTCTKGAYIRTLCADAGKRLGCGACMSSLIRTRVGNFCLSDSLTLSEIAALKEKEDGVTSNAAVPYSFVKPLDSFFEDKPEVIARPEINLALYNGNSFSAEEGAGIPDGCEARVYSSTNEFIGIYRRSGESFRLVKMFYDPVQDGS